jgi:hypothetical protein
VVKFARNSVAKGPKFRPKNGVEPGKSRAEFLADLSENG